jgi:glutamate synthase (NADPH/NADH) small chain
MIYRVSSAHEEAGERLFSVSTKHFEGNDEGKLTGLVLSQIHAVDGRFQEVPDSEETIPCDLALLAMGFTGPQRGGLLEDLGVEFDTRGNVARTGGWATNVPGVFVAGDMGRGQSLIVWAIAEGRACASAVDDFLSGETSLPAPIKPTDRPLV